jgi:hypothetical protein
MYIREVGPKDFPQTFKQWMESKIDLEAMIAEGRGKLEWERKIPDEKLVELKELLEAQDFKANLTRVLIVQCLGQSKNIFMKPNVSFKDLVLIHSGVSNQI